MPTVDPTALPDDPMERLAIAMGLMLSEPSQQDPSVTVGARHPWLVQTWDYVTGSGAYAELDYSFAIDIGSGETPFVPVECDDPGTLGLRLFPCGPGGLTVPESWLTEDWILGDRAALWRSTMVRELAHVFTLSSLVSADGNQPPRPDLHALAVFALYKQYSTPIRHECDGRELLADTLKMDVYPTTVGDSWLSCFGQDHPPEERDGTAIASSLLAGEYSDWFRQEYQQDGGFALRRVWADVLEVGGRDAFLMGLLAWQLRDAFGDGYCEVGHWSLPQHLGLPLPNPWSNRDTDAAGCDGS